MMLTMLPPVCWHIASGTMPNVCYLPGMCRSTRAPNMIVYLHMGKL